MEEIPNNFDWPEQEPICGICIACHREVRKHQIFRYVDIDAEGEFNWINSVGIPTHMWLNGHCDKRRRVLECSLPKVICNRCDSGFVEGAKVAWKKHDERHSK